MLSWPHHFLQPDFAFTPCPCSSCRLSCTLSPPSPPLQNNIERLYCTGILVIGACFYAIVVGHMSLLVNNMNPTASRHKFKKDIINNTVRWAHWQKLLTAGMKSSHQHCKSTGGFPFRTHMPRVRGP